MQPNCTGLNYYQHELVKEDDGNISSGAIFNQQGYKYNQNMVAL